MGAASDFFSEFLKLNPFPADDQLHKEFAVLASELATQHAEIGARIHRRLAAASTTEDYLAVRLDAASWMYDLYARVFAMGSTFDTLQDCIGIMERLTDGIIEVGMRRPGSMDANRLRRELRIRLKERQFHWIAACHRVAKVAETLLPDAGARADQPARASSTPAASPASADGGPSRREQVDAYLREVLEKTGKRITRTDFWKKAGYSARTEFERWQREDPRTTEAARRAFERVLRERPHLQ